MNYRIFVLPIIVLSFILASCNDKTTNPEPINYESVTIGTQVWMAKNLDVDHYSNGDPIPEVKDSAQWAKLTTGAWCYNNNDPALGAVYGKLYNWYAVNDSRGLAPDGWHLPSDEEWTTLSTYLGGDSIAGGKLKEAGTTHWQSPNTGATNETGFSALPGRYRNNGGTFSVIGYYGYWWSSTELDTTNAWNKTLNYYNSRLGRYNSNKEDGFSVRCVKD
ncbi:MAG: fibrobacter succinogenes major paralogous domain-containing protein [bacterium]